jgi:hypothetical protein
MRIYCSVGTTLRVILPQLEEGAFATPPIFDPLNDSLTSITRAATNLSMPTAGVLPVNDFGIWGEAIPGASGQSNLIFLASYVDANNYAMVVTNTGPTQIQYVIKRGGAFFIIGANNIPIANTPFQYQAIQSRIYGMGIRVKEQGGNWSEWALKDDADGRLDAPIASTYQVGARDNASHFAGYYPGLAIIAHADPKAELLRLTSKYGA